MRQPRPANALRRLYLYSASESDILRVFICPAPLCTRLTPPWNVTPNGSAINSIPRSNNFIIN